MKIFLILAGAISFVATIRGMILGGFFNNTAIFLSGITFALWGYAFFFDTLKKKKWLTAIIFAVLFIIFGFSMFLSLYGRRNTTTFDEDVVIVLGAGLAGGEVGTTLARRLDAAVRYHERNPVALIIVSGGLGYRETMSEAYAMFNYLVERGVPAERIALENVAHSTYSNMRYSRAIIDERFDQVPSVAVITSRFHMFRSVQFARRAGMDATAYSSGTTFARAPFLYVREVASVVKMWIIGR